MSATTTMMANAAATIAETLSNTLGTPTLREMIGLPYLERKYFENGYKDRNLAPDSTGGAIRSEN